MIVVVDNNKDKEKLDNYSLKEVKTIEDVLGLNIHSVVIITNEDIIKVVEYVYNLIVKKTYESL